MAAADIIHAVTGRDGRPGIVDVHAAVNEDKKKMQENGGRFGGSKRSTGAGKGRQHIH